VLKNVRPEEVESFRRQVQLVARIGEERGEVIAEEICRLSLRDPEAERLTLDKAGYLVVYPDPRRNRLTLEHYTNHGVLDCVIEGATAAALYATAIERCLLTRLDHAAYLGRELARAEQSLRTGEPYVQDRAAGTERPMASLSTACRCGPE